ncbi:MAG: DUF262 domain-containing protein, partial [Dehalococcoidia bacterium]|nr:DUF262 domain-containing protein [Dehalococcoidia bacterium]
MKAGEVKLQELLNGRIQYRVPLFQRTYSWREENWQRLWDDIVEIYAAATPRRHFIGAIVTQPMEDAPEFASKYMLIDGQQRLTTLFILLASIRDAAKGSSETTSLANELDEEALFNKHVRRDEERAKIRPTQKDRADMNAVLDGKPATQSTLVGQARRFFGEVLSKGDLDGLPFDLFKLKSRVADYLDLVSIKLDASDSAPRIFESLNNTGMALTASDLVRNHIFMSIPNEAAQEAAYEQHWRPMEERLATANGGSALTDFFWRYLMMDGSLPVYDAVFEGIRDRIDRGLNSGRTIIEELAELNDYSGLYAKISNPERFETIAPIKDAQ